MKIQKFILSLLFMIAFVFTVQATCPSGESQGRQLEHWDPINGSTEICPHADGQTWCCYDPCSGGGEE